MEVCECGHVLHADLGWHGSVYGVGCPTCGCITYKERHDPAYDPDDVADQGYHDEGFPYSGLGKVRR